MLKVVEIFQEPVVTVLRYCFNYFTALYIKQHSKVVTGISTGTLKFRKVVIKVVKVVTV